MLCREPCAQAWRARSKVLRWPDLSTEPAASWQGSACEAPPDVDTDDCLQEYCNLFSLDILKGKVTFITGGGSGIGFCIAEVLMRHGCQTIIASRNLQKLTEESVKRIRKLNSFSPSDNITAFYGINQFSHLFPEEFRVPKYIQEQEGTETPLPVRFDWRDKNVVTSVRNQETCGGCWAFSVVGSIESAYAMKGNVLEELSVQQVIDCSYNNNGCNGGSTISALNWLNQTHVKLVRYSKDPFKAQTGLCHYFSHSDFGVSITGYAAFDFSGHEEKMMKILVKWGPLVAIVDAVSWQDYLGGVIQYHCSSGEANHAVLITGFDTTVQ